MKDKTMVVWGAPANLDQRGGSVLTLDDGSDHFDGIIFGEIAPRKWMAGSDNFARTEQGQAAWPEETADAGAFVQIATVYQGDHVTIYRNGDVYAEYAARPSPHRFGVNSAALIGRRHLSGPATDTFAGVIDDARIYNEALTPEQIAALKPNQPSEPAPWAWWTFQNGKIQDLTGRYTDTQWLGGARIEDEKLILNGKGASMIARSAERPQTATSIHFVPPERAVGDVMPIFWEGEYHVYYLTNPTGNHDVHWEHIVSADLLHWKQLPAALTVDYSDPEGVEGCCIFTGCVLERDGLFHAFYTGWNPNNPEGREFVLHATSKDLISWTKHPEDMIAPDGVHYGDHQKRDFRDPQIFWNQYAKEYWMILLVNDAKNSSNVFGLLTSKDLKTWKQQDPLEGVPGDECPDYFQIGETHYMGSCRRYAYSKNINGPWKFPDLTNIINSPFCVAAKRVFDGKRHVWFGGWAKGPMAVPREIYPGPDGLLYCRRVAEATAAYTHTLLDAAVDRGLSKDGSANVFDAPSACLLECTVEMNREAIFVMEFRGDADEGEATRFAVSPSEDQVRMEGPETNSNRPWRIDTTKPVRFQVIVGDGLIECFINDEFGQTCVARQQQKGQVRFLAERGAVRLKSLILKTYR